MSSSEEDPNPPPASQSHFAKFENFTPDDDASFSHEFARLASSQEWVPGSQRYKREHTIAMREELKLHFFSQPQPLDDDAVKEEELTEGERKLMGYQALCREVGIPPSDDVVECRKHLRNTLVNIVDLIDTRRTGRAVVVWKDFEAFRKYTLQDEHRINMDEAKKDGGYLASLLQRLREPSPRRRKRKGGKRHSGGNRVASGRVIKSSAA